MSPPTRALAPCAVALTLAAGCALPMPPIPGDLASNLVQRAVTQGAGASAPAARAPSAPPPSTTAPYAPGEAIADAVSGPLEVVGVGAWPDGGFRRLSCVYRNARVVVVDERCSDPREPTGLTVHVLSPARGRATVFAEASMPIGRARRPDYGSFGAASAAPRSPPVALSASMTYEDVVASETGAPGQVRAMCSAGTQRPEGHCSKGAATSAGAWAATVTPFLREPPAAWYDLVRALVGLRVQAHAAIRPAALPLPRLVAWGASWARDQDVTVTEDQLKRVGNRYGRTAAIAVAGDGGVFIAGTTSHAGTTVPSVVRAGADGTKRWVKALPERGFVTHEEAAVAALPDGAIVLSPGYPDPGWKPTARVIRLDDKGNVRWQWLGRGKDRYKIPQVVTAEPTPKGTVLLRGFIQLVADGDVHGWTGELDAKGKELRWEVGPVLPDHGASLE
ncbi:MAG TPA: hypothetical protein VLT47_11625 [Anaeromyxobacteraceae bacterium]|nr:hypothetical protein [Anaeromyxobacteraceae bacterium]